MPDILESNFKPKQPSSAVPAQWFNTVSSILNGMVGGFGIKINKNGDGASKWVVSLDKEYVDSIINSNDTLDSSMGDNPITKLNTSSSLSNSMLDEDLNFTWEALKTNSNGEKITDTTVDKNPVGIIIELSGQMLVSGSTHYVERLIISINSNGTISSVKSRKDRIRIGA